MTNDCTLAEQHSGEGRTCPPQFQGCKLTSAICFIRYLLEHYHWAVCREPKYIVHWNVTLFSLLLIMSAYEMILCIVQIVHGCVGGAWTVCHGEREVSAFKSYPKLHKSILGIL